jgi:GNAT superfamily N-acetyltransferase
MKIRKLDIHSKQDVDQFVMFPYKLYADCPQWVPPLIGGQRKLLDPNAHPYYSHSTADFVVAEDDQGNTLGRIALMNNTHYNRYLNENNGLFGYFDVVDDQSVANALFEYLSDWAHANGFDQVLGPNGLLTTEQSGVLIEGFEHRPALNVPYNYPYYQKFFEDAGFEKDREALSGHIHIPDASLPDRVVRITERVMERYGFSVKTFANKDEMREMIEEAQHVMHEAFSDGHRYVPATDEEFKYAAEDLITIADPGLIKVILKDGKIAGFLFAYHDISAGLQRAKGRLLPFGWIHILLAKRRTKWVNVNGLGILPEYQGQGGNAVLYYEMAKTIQSFDFEDCETVWIGEENYRSFSDNTTMGVTWYKRHRNYFKKF